MNKVLFIIGFLILSESTAFSQDHTQIDFDSLLQKAKVFYKTNQDSALYYSGLAYKKALKQGDVSVIGQAIAQHATYLISKKKYQEAEKLLNQNLQNKSKINKIDLGITYANLGSINSLKEQRDVALENYIAALDIFEEISSHDYLARTYLNIGIIYENEGKNEQADFFYDKSLYHSR